MRHIHDFKKPISYQSGLRRRASGRGQSQKFLIGALVVAIISWVYTFYFSPLFAISNIRIDGLETISRSSIESLLAAGGKNIFSFNAAAGARKIRDAYFIENVSISKQYPQSLQVVIAEKHPAIELKTIGDDYVLDGAGLVIEALHASSTDRQRPALPLIEYRTNQLFQVRDQAIGKDNIAAMNFFIDGLKSEDNIMIERVVIDTEEPDVLTLKTTAGFDCIVSSKENKKLQMDKLTVFLKAHSADFNKLLYVNARFVDRIYFKLK